MFHDRTRSSSCCLSRFAWAALLLLAVPVAAQTHLILDINPGIAGSSTNAIAVLGELAIFVGIDPVEGTRLYSSDGTAAGTTVVAVLDATPPFASPGELVASGERVFFPWGTTSGLELWATDGTTAGTGLVKEINVGPFGSNPRDLADIDGVLYFGAAESGGNYELWRSDGTAAGTWLVKEIHTTTGTGSNPGAFARLGTTGSFLFAATDATSGRELWISDGTTAGTSLVKDIVPGPGSTGASTPRFLVSLGDHVAFSTSPPFVSTSDLWISDGTDAGTVLLMAGINPRQLAVQGGRLFFQGYDTAHGQELWTSDGTTAGTHLLTDIYVGGVPAWGSSPFVLTPVGSRWVFFSAFNGFGEELWRTDGVTTELFQDINIGSASSAPAANGYPGTHLLNSRFAVTAMGKMFFVANDGVHGAEPFVYDTGILATTTTFGAGCGGLSLATTTPYLDSTVDLITSGIPVTSPLSMNFLSLTGFVPPIDLGFLDMPGCFLHCMLDVMLVFAGTGTVTNTLAIPDDPTWHGITIHGQTLSFVPGVNPFGAITSNGVSMFVGDL